MKIKELLDESKVSYSTDFGFKKFRVKSDTPLSFSDLKKHPEILKRMGPHSTIFDVSNEERVKNAPGENKWNAMKAMYGQDDDEIVCADSWKGQEWLCAAINIMT